MGQTRRVALAVLAGLATLQSSNEPEQLPRPMSPYRQVRA